MADCYDCGSPGAIVERGGTPPICNSCRYAISDYKRGTCPVTAWDHPKDGVFFGLIDEVAGGVVAEIYDEATALRIRKALILLDQTEEN